MNPYIIPCTCDVCGEEGMLHARHGYGANWLGTVRHQDPQVCAENLEARRRELDAREAALKSKEGDKP